MSFIFGNPASGAGKTYRQQRQYISNAIGNASNAIDSGVNPAVSTLQAQAAALKKQGLPAVSLTGTAGGLTGGINKKGVVDLNRTPEAQGFMTNLGQGLSTDEASYNDLLSALTPQGGWGAIGSQGPTGAWGALADAATQDLNNQYDKQVGDVQANMAKRRILGSSFAQGTVDSINRQRAQDIQQARADALVKQLQMTQSVINDRSTARLNTIGKAFDQINYESGVKATLLANTQNNMMKLQDAQNDLAKTIAGIQAQGGIAKADVISNLSGIGAQGYGQLASLNAEGKAAQQASIGSFIGNFIPSFGSSSGSFSTSAAPTGLAFGNGSVGPSNLVF